MKLINKIFLSLIALIGIINITSCIDASNSLGTSFIPTNQDISIMMDEFELPVTMKVSDSIQSYSSSYLSVGSINTPEFGLVNLAAACDICPDHDTLEFKGNPKFKSMTILMNISKMYAVEQSEINIIQNLYAYQLKRPIDTLDIYNNSMSAEDHEKEIISQGLPIISNDSVIILKVKEEFGAQFLTATSEELDSLDLFSKRFKGIYIETDVQNPNIYGGRINYVDLSNSYAALTYERTDSTGARTDTTVTFILGYNYSANMNSTSSHHLATDEPTEEIYLEGLSGVKPYVKGKDIRAIMDEWAKKNEYNLNDVIITRASIVLPYEYPDNYKKLNYFPGNIYACQRFADDSIPFYTPLEEVYDNTVTRGDNNRSLLEYRLDINHYLQELIRMDADEVGIKQDLWLMPLSESESSSSSSSNNYYDYYNYYNYLNYYSYYDYYGYGNYYGGYYNNFYNNSSSSETYYTTDYVNYYIAKLNGNKSDNGPKLKITYSYVK
ncbi:MAG: hypothetical protein IKL26_04100 [Bacteroidales bacterium]|nr:hypothetical protein [Bacteroidales bacterium]